MDLSYGYHRSEVIGALCSVAIIWGLTIWLLYEAIVNRLFNPVEINGLVMMITAAIGLVINLCMMKVLHSTPGGHAGCSHSHGHSHSHESKPYLTIINLEKSDTIDSLEDDNKES